MTDHWDALVIGGGPGGATAALLLARAGWSVVLLERKVYPRRKVCGEYLSATNGPLLRHLGIDSAFREAAGPEVCRVALFAGETMTWAQLPRPGGRAAAWGRALRREQLDSLLLKQAARAGVDVRQPWSAVDLARDGDAYRCRAESRTAGAVDSLRARVIIAAHGSWDSGTLPTQTVRQPAEPGDLLAFKAHFRNSNLPAGLMPLLAFPGGYGGMVHCDGGRVTLSCCLRRDALVQIRREPGAAAGEAVRGYIEECCLGVRRALAGAIREGPWLAAGPIRPGVRLHQARAIFPVGNAAGEAHPVIAEGISMAMQSAWLLSRGLIHWRHAGGSVADLAAVAEDYAAAWKQNFAMRVHASTVLAQWAMHPTAVACAVPLLRCFPPLLTWGSRWSGKAKRIVAAPPTSGRSVAH